MRKIFYSLYGILFLALPFYANADLESGLGCHGNDGYGFYGQGGMMGSGGNFLLGYGWIIPLIFWILLVVFAIAVFMHFSKGQKLHSVSANETPEDILKMRFAKGEIGKEEFEQTRKELKK